ncbi:glycosyltransferase family 9 protein [Pantoea sp. RRHST58]|uniref:glycosyltransferase family 9 protein n=1 Tax=Pantoea sp. RRHST58 TaxID=3425183 RepID=UPI003DA0B7C5
MIFAQGFRRVINKIRALNRQRNYFLKGIKIKLRLALAKILWDRRKKASWNPDKVQKILIIRNEGTIGDVIVYSSFIEALSKRGYCIDILLTEANKTVIEYNPYIRKAYVCENATTEVFLKSFTPLISREIVSTLRENHYDLVIDPCLETPVHRVKLLHDIDAKMAIGFNKWHCINHYSKSLDFASKDQHITQSVAQLAAALKIENIKSIPYKLHIPENVQSDVVNFLHHMGKQRVVLINIFAGNKERCLSQEQLANIINKLLNSYCNVKIIILDHLNKIDKYMSDFAVINPFKTLHHAMALIASADLIITPDTSIVHISAAWEKPLISIYKDIDDNNMLWAPGYSNASQIIFHRRQLSQVAKIEEAIAVEIDKRSLLEKA